MERFLTCSVDKRCKRLRSMCGN